ncbi:hypothetical protein D3C87_1440150 [compost metagenome]
MLPLPAEQKFRLASGVAASLRRSAMDVSFKSLAVTTNKGPRPSMAMGAKDLRTS